MRWQPANKLHHVQAVREEGASKIANHPVRFTLLGETDAGVHAQSVDSFYTDYVRQF